MIKTANIIYRVHKLHKMDQCVLQKFVFTSPIGNLTLEQCDNGLHSINQTTSPSIQSVNRVDLLDPCEVKANHGIWQAAQWLQAYFLNPQKLSLRKIPAICNAALSTDTFRGKVRHALLENVKFGQTISYGKLAELVSCQGGARAVATAMSNNPLSILVPCHRVIKSDGSLGNYGKGTRNEVKKWLLEHEETNSR